MIRANAWIGRASGVLLAAMVGVCSSYTQTALALDDPNHVVAVAVGGSNRSDADSPDPASEAVRLLAMLSDPSRGTMDTAARIEALGPKGLAAAFARLCADDSVPGDGPDDSALRRRSRSAVVAALWQAPDSVRAQILQEAVPESAGPSARIAVLEVLATRPRVDDVRLAIAAIRHGAGRSLRMDVYASFESCVVSMIQRDVRSLEGLRTDAVWRDPDAALHCACAVARAERWDGIELLLSAMNDPDLEPSIIPALAQLASIAPPARRELPAQRLRACLDRRDESAVAAAALALGLLRDESSVPALIEIADRDEEKPRDAAFWALRKISGLDLRPWAHRWRIWYRDEQRWHVEHAAATAESLESGKAERIIAAITAVQGRTFGRAEWARRLSPLLESESAEIRMIACSAMQTLGSDAAVPALALAMRSEDARLRTAATDAVRAITGREASEVVAAWQWEFRR